MKRDTDNYVYLELSDLIRMNQFVRGAINLGGFATWYDSLDKDERANLLCALHEFAEQAFCDENVWQLAIEASGMDRDDALMRQVAAFRGGMSDELIIEFDWVMQISESDRHRLLPLLVYLFGYAESRAFSNCPKESCNHWWHRDLLDERVIDGLLANPDFWRTAMRHDGTN